MSEPTPIKPKLSIEEEAELELVEEEREDAKKLLKSKKKEIRQAERILRQLKTQEKDLLIRIKEGI